MTARPVIIRRSRRRTISLSVGKDLSVVLKAPYSVPERELLEFADRHAAWIEKQVLLQAERNEKAESLRFTDAQIAEMKEQAWTIVQKRVLHYARVMGVTPTGLKITSAATRWGSCSASDRLCFSYRVVLLPPDAVDYIVVHELAHIRVKNHSADFYREVGRYLPDYRRRIELIRAAQRRLGL